MGFCFLARGLPATIAHLLFSFLNSFIIMLSNSLRCGSGPEIIARYSISSFSGVAFWLNLDRVPIYEQLSCSFPWLNSAPKFILLSESGIQQ